MNRGIYQDRPSFRAAWWLANPHLQTLWGKAARRDRLVATRAERWELPDGDFLDLERLDAPGGAPHLLLLHGLEGTPASHYVRSAFLEAARRGWGATLLIFRGCSGTMNRARRMYHSGETTDLDHVVRRLAGEDAARAIVIAGFSLGGNVTLKWLGEQGAAAPAAVRAAAVASVPFDLARGSRHLERGFARVYTRAFLRTLVRKAEAKVAQHPDVPVDLAAARAARTLWAFDDAVTAPLHGFPDAETYYARSSSLGYLAGIRRPVLCLSAVDDPFVPPAVLDDVAAVARTQAHLTLDFPARGGHVGFVGGALPWRPVYFAERRMVDWLATHLGPVAGGAPPGSPSPP
jgi:predicted alpha/beta-fold hydrolase